MDDKTIKKVQADAARAAAILEEERFNGLIEDFCRLFRPELPLFIPCVRGDKMPLKGVTWTKYTQKNIREDTEAARHYFEQFRVAVVSGGQPRD